jgi:hypothetical protein
VIGSTVLFLCEGIDGKLFDINTVANDGRVLASPDRRPLTADSGGWYSALKRSTNRQSVLDLS